MNKYLLIIWLSRIILIGNSVYLVCTLQFNGLFLLGSGLLLSFLPEVYTKLCKIRIPLLPRTLYVIFLICTQWLGSYLRLYDYFPWWDAVLHFLSGFLLGYIALVIWITLDQEGILLERKKMGLFFLMIMTVASTGALLWEIIEFSSDQLLGTFTQLGSLEDTMTDLILGALGGVLFTIYLSLKYYFKKASCITKLIEMNKNK